MLENNENEETASMLNYEIETASMLSCENRNCKYAQL